MRVLLKKNIQPLFFPAKPGVKVLDQNRFCCLTLEGVFCLNPLILAWMVLINNLDGEILKQLLPLNNCLEFVCGFLAVQNTVCQKFIGRLWPVLYDLYLGWENISTSFIELRHILPFRNFGMPKRKHSSPRDNRVSHAIKSVYT